MQNFTAKAKLLPFHKMNAFPVQHDINKHSTNKKAN